MGYSREPAAILVNIIHDELYKIRERVFYKPTVAGIRALYRAGTARSTTRRRDGWIRPRLIRGPSRRRLCRPNRRDAT